MLYTPAKTRILLLENIHPVAKQRLNELGYQVDLRADAMSPDELSEAAVDFDVIGVRSKTQVLGSVVEKNPHLAAVGCFCIGTNQVDLVRANELGIPVFNAPYSNTRSVAELVIAETIALSRQLAERSMWAHQGKWAKSAEGSREVRGKTLGIVGYGHIGSQVSVLAEALGMQVVYFDIVKKLPLGNAQPVETLNDLLAVSDFVTLHVPETDDTQNMMGAAEFSKMKPTAHFINASRGTVVDVNALRVALDEQIISGAAVDVFPEEPKSNNDTFHSVLQGAGNVILTPHIGGSTEEAQEAIGLEVVESFHRFLSQGASAGSVNFPQLELPPLNKVHRILNVHKNIPGVLSRVNTLVSEAGVNIKAQHLATNNTIGYLAIDVDEGNAHQLAKNIEKLDVSIKTREVY